MKLTDYFTSLPHYFLPDTTVFRVQDKIQIENSKNTPKAGSSTPFL